MMANENTVRQLIGAKDFILRMCEPMDVLVRNWEGRQPTLSIPIWVIRAMEKFRDDTGTFAAKVEDFKKLIETAEHEHEKAVEQLQRDRQQLEAKASEQGEKENAIEADRATLEEERIKIKEEMIKERADVAKEREALTRLVEEAATKEKDMALRDAELARGEAALARNEMAQAKKDKELSQRYHRLDGQLRSQSAGIEKRLGDLKSCEGEVLILLELHKETRALIGRTGETAERIRSVRDELKTLKNLRDKTYTEMMSFVGDANRTVQQTRTSVARQAEEIVELRQILEGKQIREIQEVELGITTRIQEAVEEIEGRNERRFETQLETLARDKVSLEKAVARKMASELNQLAEALMAELATLDGNIGDKIVEELDFAQRLAASRVQEGINDLLLRLNPSRRADGIERKMDELCWICNLNVQRNVDIVGSLQQFRSLYDADKNVRVDAERKVGAILDNISELHAQVPAHFRTLDKKVDELNEPIDKLLAKVGEVEKQLPSKLSSVDEKVGSICTGIEKLQSDGALLRDLDTKVSTLQRLPTELESMISTVGATSTGIEKLQTSTERLNGLDVKVDALQRLPVELQDVIGKVRFVPTMLKALHAGKNKLDLLLGRTDGLERLSPLMQDLQGKADQVPAEARKLQGEVDRLETELCERFEGMQLEVDKLKDVPKLLQGVKTDVGKLNEVPELIGNLPQQIESSIDRIAAQADQHLGEALVQIRCDVEREARHLGKHVTASADTLLGGMNDSVSRGFSVVQDDVLGIGISCSRALTETSQVQRGSDAKLADVVDMLYAWKDRWEEHYRAVEMEMERRQEEEERGSENAVQASQHAPLDRSCSQDLQDVKSSLSALHVLLQSLTREQDEQPVRSRTRTARPGGSDGQEAVTAQKGSPSYVENAPGSKGSSEDTRKRKRSSLGRDRDTSF